MPFPIGDVTARLAEIARHWYRQAVVVTWAVNAFKLLRRRRYHDALSLVARAEALSGFAGDIACRTVLRLADRRILADRGVSSDRWVNSDIGRQARERFAHGGQRDFAHANIIVLKPYLSPAERGILAVKYSEVIDAFPVLFDVPAIQKRYHLILEPSTTGHMQVFTRMLEPHASVCAVETLTRRDADQFSLQGFLSLPICAGDWVDETAFRPIPDADKRFDFVMVSNFHPIKRHEFVFSALRTHWRGPLRFALVGSSHVAGGVAGIRDCLSRYGLSESADLFVDIDAEEVNAVLNASHCHVLASLREGANRATYEALFAGTPALLPKAHVGFPKWRYPPGIVSEFVDAADLVARIRQARNVDAASAREVISRMSGSVNATRVVAVAMSAEARRRGESWTTEPFRHVNRVQASYFHGEDWVACREDYRFLESAARDGFDYRSDVARAMLLRR